MLHKHAYVTVFWAMRALTSPATTEIDGYLNALPSPDSPTLHDTNLVECIPYASARGLVGEVLESEGRHADAIVWAQTEVNEPRSLNMCKKIRAGCLLGRLHAAVHARQVTLSRRGTHP